MRVSKLLRFLLTAWMSPGIVEAGGGGAADEEEQGDDTASATGDEADTDNPDAAADPGAAAAAGDAADAEGDELVVTLGEDDTEDDLLIEQPDDSQPIRQLRNRVKELTPTVRKQERQIRGLQAELEQIRGASAQQQTVDVGDEPDIDDYETFNPEGKAKFKADYTAWMGRKAEAEAQTRKRNEAEQQQRQQWQGRIDAVGAAAKALKVRDFSDAAQAFEDSFSVVQRGIIIGGPDDAKSSALLQYALGKNPKKAKELAAITDPVKFAIAIGKLETQLKTTTRKTAPTPDKPVRSAVAGAAAVDSQLARLEAEADKTGDRSKVASYRRTKLVAQRAA